MIIQKQFLVNWNPKQPLKECGFLDPPVMMALMEVVKGGAESVFILERFLAMLSPLYL